MTQITVSLFWDYLRRSRLVEEARLDAAIAKMRVELGPEKCEQLDAVTRWCVSQKFVTEWQVKQLLRKRYKGFFLRQYKILSHIGTGGMSTVYLAEHCIMQRRVAIKVLPKKKLERSIYLDRFIREAQTIASLDHPNIVRAYDIDQEDDVHYIVMEYFNGRNLQEVVAQDGVMPFEMAADYVRQAALALEYAHQAGVVHRDVKPGNVLVNTQGLVKVLDLGLALLDEHNFDGQLTSIQEDKILGTADYLAPEQGIDSHTVDGRADIYGLGGVLYFCLTGHPPFPTGTIPQRLLAHQHEEPQSIFVDRPEVPDSLVRLCRKMMAKKKEERQQSAIEVVVDMQNWLIENGFAVESDFPPLETLRASTETLGAVPIPTQAERLRDLDDEQWLARQQREHQQYQQYRQSSLALQSESDGSTVSGMMRPPRKGGQSGSGASDVTQIGSASSTDAGSSRASSSGLKNVSLNGLSGMGSTTGEGDSASRIHLLTDGQSSALMSNPNASANANIYGIANTETNTDASVIRRRGIIDDDAPLTVDHSSSEENDPVLLALNEIAAPPQKAKPVPKPQNKAPQQAQQQTKPQSTTAKSTATQQAKRGPSQNESSQPTQAAKTSAARTVSQALAAELHDDGTASDAASHTHNFKPREWQRHVPIWFWFLFGGFVISTIFLAGILVAIIFRM